MENGFVVFDAPVNFTSDVTANSKVDLNGMTYVQVRRGARWWPRCSCVCVARAAVFGFGRGMPCAGQWAGVNRAEEGGDCQRCSILLRHGSSPSGCSGWVGMLAAAAAAAARHAGVVLPSRLQRLRVDAAATRQHY